MWARPPGICRPAGSSSTWCCWIRRSGAVTLEKDPAGGGQGAPHPAALVLCESETGLVLPAQVGGLTLQKQYKYGKVLLWKYTKPMQQEGEAR